VTAHDGDDALAVPVADGPVDAVVRVPGSKSIANRALVCAALARGVSTLTGVPAGDDTSAMVDALRALGIAVDVDSDSARVTGCDGRPGHPSGVLHARLAGTTSRFMTALAALAAGPVTIDGDPPLRRRPMAPLHEALGALGARVTPLGERGHLPVEVAGPLRGGAVAMRGDVSSQYVTALMLIGPCVPGGIHIRLKRGLVSRPYVGITAAVMSSFGAGDVRVGSESIDVPPGAYVATQLAIEPDASSASYPLAVAALVGGTVRVEGLGPDAVQGDARFADLLAAMGCDVRRDHTGTTVSRDPSVALRGIDVDMADVSDLVPTLAVVAAAATTPTRIRGVGFIRSKESDRLGDLATELARTGAEVTEAADGLDIRPAVLHGARLATHDDHRLAMAFGALGTAVGGIEVETPGVVSKSWPGYWTALTGILASTSSPPTPTS
jgi:3-phosphoshikimate 1-carboxyvinyltransferase